MRAPGRAGTTAHDPIAVEATHDEARFGQTWNHGDALGILEQGRWNLLRRRHVLDHLRSSVHLLRRVRRPGYPRKHHDECECDNFCHYPSI